MNPNWNTSITVLIILNSGSNLSELRYPPTSGWMLHHRLKNLTIDHFPKDFQGSPLQLSEISNLLCDLRIQFRLKLTCCVILMKRSPFNKYTHLTTLERLIVWRYQPTTRGDFCINWGQVVGTTDFLPTTYLCQALHCYPSHFISAHCREGCMHCGSPCRQNYSSSYFLGWD